MATDHQNDKELENYLKGNSELSRRYREEAAVQPPKQLDDAVLAAAREEPGKPGGNVFRLFPRDWYRPLSKVALLVVCISLLFTLYETGQQSPPGSPGLAVIPDTNTLPGEDSGGRPLEMADKKFMENGTKDTVGGDAATGVSQTPVPSLDSNRAADRIIQLDEVRTEPAEMQELEPLQPAPSAAAGGGVTEQDRPVQMLKRELTAQDAMPAAGISEEEWLNKISELWRAGKKEEAVASLEEFLGTYPDYPHTEIINRLPEDFDPGSYIENFAKE